MAGEMAAAPTATASAETRAPRSAPIVRRLPPWTLGLAVLPAATAFFNGFALLRTRSSP